MQTKSTKYTFRGMNRDVSEGKHPLEFYYEANNMRFLTTDDVITGGLSFEKGNEKKVTLPDVTINDVSNTILLSNGTAVTYTNNNEIDKQVADGKLPTQSGQHIILGHTTSRSSIILFSTDDNGMDCIWEVNVSDYSVKLLYLRNLGFSSDHPIQAVFNYENEIIQKVYWVDGHNQIRFINVRHSKDNGNIHDLINVDSNTIDFVGNFDISQPEITNVVSGGNHTAGRVQYTYNLYRLNASQTKLAPLSELVSLTKGANQGGGEVNEVVGSTPVVRIANLDSEYTHVKVYAIKYTSYNQVPSISLVSDEEIPSTREITIFDDGNKIADISMEELLFLGSDPIVPQHLESKENTLFSGNIKEKTFDVKLDTRAYSFPSNSGVTNVYDNIKSENENHNVGTRVYSSTFVLSEKHDAINLNYDKYRYQPNSTRIGGEGKYVKYELIKSFQYNVEDRQFFKDYEVYRLGLVFYNRLGQTSLPKWMADFRAPEGNLDSHFSTLKVTLKPEFYVWLNTSSNFENEDEKPVGYKVLRANRTVNDRTIVAQGLLSPMMSVHRGKKLGDISVSGTSDERTKWASAEKVPSLIRVFDNSFKQSRGMKDGRSLCYTNSGNHSGEGAEREANWATSQEQNGVADTHQFNTLMQMYSPDIMFGSVSLNAGMKLRVKGAATHRNTDYWGQEIDTETEKVTGEVKVSRGLTPHDNGAGVQAIIGSGSNLANYGIFGPSHQEHSKYVDFHQFRRDYSQGIVTGNIPNASRLFDVYGTPMMTERGQGFTTYNGDPDYRFYNSLQPMMADGGDERGMNSAATSSVNTFGAKCVTFVLGNQSPGINGKVPLEKLYQRLNINNPNSVIISEFIKPDVQIYMGNIYGGNSYEAKKRTNYIEIGEYKDINSSSVLINSPGDTYVGKFKFARLAKTDTKTVAIGTQQLTEIVEVNIESDVALHNRHDISVNSWDSRWQPRYEEYHKYNRVYSQQPTLREQQDMDYNFRQIKNFDTRIMASKKKIPGEYIDSWTDLLVNESMDLNGKYGRLNGLISFNDQLYAFQDTAFALVAVNPRVQTQANDGLSIELGTGGVLHDYKYVTTSSGSINKWGMVTTANGIYYLDALNKSIMRFTGQGLEGLSSTRGLHKYLQDNVDFNSIKNDNIIKRAGLSMGYDPQNNDVYLTHDNSSNLWTLCFNEKLGEFSGFYSYNSPMYIYVQDRMLTVSPHVGEGHHLYEMHAGNYNIIHGKNVQSSIKFIANPEPDHECTFNNLEYKSVAKDASGIEQRYTWERIHVRNEFQDSGLRPLGQGSIRKLNRKYRLNIPRKSNSSERIRNNWAFIELYANNKDALFYVNQDIVLHYSPNYIAIR